MADLGGVRIGSDYRVRCAALTSPALDWRSHVQDRYEERGVPMTTPFRVRLEAYGEWIGGLAPWVEFVTLTHRPLTERGYGSRVGMTRHKRMVHDWFYGEQAFRGRGVRDVDPSARWWSETEHHLTGIPHEHGLLSTDVSMLDRKEMRDSWREVNGSLVKAQGARFDRIRDTVGAAAYVAKYTEKSATHQPRIFGFGFTSVWVRDVGLEVSWRRALGEGHLSAGPVGGR